MMKMMLTSALLAVCTIGQSNPLDITQRMVRAQMPSVNRVADHKLLPWPGTDCIVRFIDHRRGALGVMRYEQRSNRMVWYGWVPMDEQMIGRTITTKNWGQIVQRRSRQIERDTQREIDRQIID